MKGIRFAMASMALAASAALMATSCQEKEPAKSVALPEDGAPEAAAPAAPARAKVAMPLGDIKSYDDAIAAIKESRAYGSGDAAAGLERVKNGEQGINTCVFRTMNPVAYAADLGNRDMVAFFLSQGADVNGVDPENEKSSCSLVRAIESVEKAEKLVQEKKHEGGLVKELLMAGADVSLKAGEKYTPLELTAVKQKLPEMKMLVEYGADPKAVDEKGGTLLMRAVWPSSYFSSRSDYIGVMDYLIDTCGLDPNAKNNAGETAIMRACGRLNVEEIQHLIAKGADPAAKANDQTALPCFVAWECRDKAKALEILKSLEKYNLDFSVSPDPKASHPLLLVVQSANNAKEALPLIAYMMEHGTRAEGTVDSQKNTLLHIAVGNGFIDGPEVLQFLLDKKVADVNAINAWGDTALMKVKSPCLVEPLVKAGASPALKNKSGKTAYRIASGNPKLKAAFEAAGVTE